ncbi:NAD(P)/FAD-dependent oxidoreductase [Vitiosangium sp. GDMCC 1.1324]|uniref:phytoene desaturase family protein n=1 Tax=Vitiosangium sp. (strain GDMCC 1.1324) TaxID=2138576 RepID=UPI00130EEF1A|nr:FAD-dependent oxidoreductase [Vitiosangium sp. GDMCC 1.1324]
MARDWRTNDVVIVGCGLSGLTAGLFLLRRGYGVTILERRSSYGGLCGTFEMDGREFVIACNDFGQGLVRTLEELGVPLRFKSKKTRIFYGDRVYELPLSAGTALRLAPHMRALARFFLGLRRARRAGEGTRSLGEFVDSTVGRCEAGDLLKLPAYLMGVRPEDFQLHSLWDEFQYDYGYSKPATPVGGPQVLADTLANRFLAGGGTILLSTECRNVHTDGDGYTLDTSAGELRARAVLSTAERTDPALPGSKPGLPVSMFCVAVSKELPYPEEIHTLVHYPPGISDWFGKLDSGVPSSEFGFHLFRSELPEKPDHYTLNIYFYLPRGVEEPEGAYVQQAEDYIFSHAERMLPGLGKAILYKRFVSPRMFSQRHGLSSRVTPLITGPGIPKADNHDAGTGLYYAGNSVFPPGDHAGAAILSARISAGLIANRLSP